MGKPYKSELHQLEKTYQWALEAPIKGLSNFVTLSHDEPLFAVGSGGSMTSAHFATLLHESIGTLAKSVTPLELLSTGNALRNSGVLILSAGGRNSDILTAFRFAATAEPRHLMALCMATGSPLSRLAAEYRYSHLLEFDLPSEKDGFLATNSLLATATFLIRAYQEFSSQKWELPLDLISSDKTNIDPLNTEEALLDRETLVILYGGWAYPAAADAESKFTEAALGNVQIADYRNFAHGRHHWLAKRGQQSGVIALITPDEKEIAERTLGLLPKNIPVLQLITEKRGPVGGLELLVKVLRLVDIVGGRKGIDPGRPGVPPFGRSIYHLRIPQSNGQNSYSNLLDGQAATAILRKSKCASITELDREELDYWKNAYDDFLLGIEGTSFGTVVFDYDGTLCDLSERFNGPPKEIYQQIVRLLRGGIIVGIATGRGQSVRKDLQPVIPKKYWERVIIGYYNGSDIAPLSDNNHPNKNEPLDEDLQVIRSLLDDHWQFRKIAKNECRPKQITVEPKSAALWKEAKWLLLDIIKKSELPCVQVLESSHSIDIIASGVSKKKLVAVCEDVASSQGSMGAAFCVGDRGEWPGNDYDLLSYPWSLSVDVVSPDPKSCWNLARPGFRGVQATLSYLNCLSFVDDHLHFKHKKDLKSK